jgi:hypothetical protein
LYVACWRRRIARERIVSLTFAFRGQLTEVWVGEPAHGGRHCGVMWIARYGIIVFAFAIGLSALMAWRVLLAPPVRLPRHEPGLANVQKVKADLCRLGHSERRYFNATGHYAGRYELPSNGDFAVPRERWPYFYQIYVQVPDRFVVAAIPFRAVDRKLTVLTVDHSLRICALSPNVSSVDDEPQNWDASYSCEPCPPER